MTVEEIIRPGDKIEISQVVQEKRDGDAPQVYMSKVLDIKENGNIEIAMPVERGKLVLLTLGIRYNFVFFSRGGLYRATAQIKERYKSENIYMLEVELKTQLEKFQRREFYRYPCILNISYYILTREEAELGNGEAIYVRIQSEESEPKTEYNGTIIDLSGGGIKLVTREEVESGTYILLQLHLRNEEIDKQYYILGTAIAAEKVHRSGENFYEIRVKFLIHDNNIREEIIKYIFEEERKTRQRGKR